MRLHILTCALIFSILPWSPWPVQAGDMKASDWPLLAPVEMSHESGKGVAEVWTDSRGSGRLAAGPPGFAGGG